MSTIPGYDHASNWYNEGVARRCEFVEPENPVDSPLSSSEIKKSLRPIVHEKSSETFHTLTQCAIFQFLSFLGMAFVGAIAVRFTHVSPVLFKVSSIGLALALVQAVAFRIATLHLLKKRVESMYKRELVEISFFPRFFTDESFSFLSFGNQDEIETQTEEELESPAEFFPSPPLEERTALCSLPEERLEVYPLVQPMPPIAEPIEALPKSPNESLYTLQFTPKPEHAQKLRTALAEAYHLSEHEGVYTVSFSENRIPKKLFLSILKRSCLPGEVRRVRYALTVTTLTHLKRARWKNIQTNLQRFLLTTP